MDPVACCSPSITVESRGLRFGTNRIHNNPGTSPKGIVVTPGDTTHALGDTRDALLPCTAPTAAHLPPAAWTLLCTSQAEAFDVGCRLVPTCMFKGSLNAIPSKSHLLDSSKLFVPLLSRTPSPCWTCAPSSSSRGTSAVPLPSPHCPSGAQSQHPMLPLRWNTNLSKPMEAFSPSFSLAEFCGCVRPRHSQQCSSWQGNHPDCSRSWEVGLAPQDDTSKTLQCSKAQHVPSQDGGECSWKLMRWKLMRT